MVWMVGNIGTVWNLWLERTGNIRLVRVVGAVGYERLERNIGAVGNLWLERTRD